MLRKSEIDALSTEGQGAGKRAARPFGNTGLWALAALLMVCADAILPCRGAAVMQGSTTTQECALCHIGWVESFRGNVPEGGASRVWQPERVQETLGVVAGQEMCYSCHDGFVRDGRQRVWEGKGHSVGRVPSKNVRVPETFPLNREGKVYCGTCHTPHGVGEQTAEVTGSVFLRVENVNSQLCKTCHGSKMASPRRTNHPVDVRGRENVPSEIYTLGGRLGSDPKLVICQSCHTPHGRGALVKPADNSSLCFTCHQDKRGFGARLDQQAPVHPVNVKPSASMAGPVKGFVGDRPGSRLGGEGEIECLTCHGMHIGQDRALLLKTGSQPFCTTCHKEQEERLAGTKHDLTKTAPESKNRRGLTPGESGLCGACHFAHGWAAVTAGGQEDASVPCLTCHNRRGMANQAIIGEYSHPTRLAPARLEANSPLRVASSGGARSMSCATCHNPHVYDPNPGNAIAPLDRDGDSTNSFLRMPGKEMCRQCHPDQYRVSDTKHDLGRLESKGFKADQEKVEREGVCMGCHRVHNAKAPYLWNRTPFPAPDVGGQLCGACHAEGQCAGKKKIFLSNHPLGVPMAEGMETTLPLYDKAGVGKGSTIACFSCHNPHQWTMASEDDHRKKERFEEGGPKDSFLRMPNDSTAALCLACHPEKDRVLGTDHDMRLAGTSTGEKLPKDTSACGGCHKPHSNDRDRQLWAEGLYGVGPQSNRACLACHRRGGRAGERQLTTMHPMSPSDSPQDVLHLTLFMKDTVFQVPLAVTCRSCHDPHQWAPGDVKEKAVSAGVEGDGSNSFLKMATLPDGNLCLNCHRDKISVIGTKHDLRLFMKEEGRLPEDMKTRTAGGGPCAACHMPHYAKAQQYLWANELAGGNSLAEKECLGCHSRGQPAEGKVPHRYSHPSVLLQPAMKQARIPPEVSGPLLKCLVYDENGSVTCFTCHNPHRWESTTETPWKGTDFRESAKTRFLRLPNDKHVCKVCHGAEGLYRYLYFHNWDRISTTR